MKSYYFIILCICNDNNQNIVKFKMLFLKMVGLSSWARCSQAAHRDYRWKQMRRSYH
jgi:hypothetical protein